MTQERIGSVQDATDQVVLGKVTRRLIPFLFILYIVAYLDRVNVGFAQLQMKQALGFSDSVYGFGAGLFFVGYFLFEIPSNLILRRVGARFWIARIMVFWGLIAIAMMFIKTATQFYVMRFLLGVGEAGFFPGVIYYLTQWFPSARRARAISLFMTATAAANLVGAPISGAILDLHGAGGMHGWQWLFVLEGIPAVAMGAAVLLYLPNDAKRVNWLSDEEKAWLQKRLSEDHNQGESKQIHSLGEAMKNPLMWVFSFIYLGTTIGMYGLVMWLPQIVKNASGFGNLGVGFLTAIPFAAAVAAMVLVGRHSDKVGERRRHAAVSLFVGACGFVLSAIAPSLPLKIIGFSIAAAGVWGVFGPFWAMPASFLRGNAAAGGIALINSTGNLGGFVGPFLMGYLIERTGSSSGASIVIAAALVGGGVLTLLGTRGRLQLAS